MKKWAILPALAAIFSGALSGCNVWGGIDSPGGDTQLLSAARAAFDGGDYAQASKYYQQLSANDADIANSEQAYLVLQENGAGMGNFISAFGEHPNPPQAITHLAGSLSASVNSGQTARVNMFTAYTSFIKGKIQNADLLAFSQFVFASALLAEVLGEQATTHGTLVQSDLVTNPSSCVSTFPAGCVAHCSRAATSNLSSAGTSFNTLDDAAATFSGTNPTDYMINGAAGTISAALQTLSAQSSFGTALAQALLGDQSVIALDNGDGAACYQGELLSLSIGIN